MLNDRHFLLVLLLAVLIHLSGLTAWNFSPKPHVTDIPIRTLNIRLGDGEEDMLEATQAPAPPSASPLEAAVERAAEEAPAPKVDPNNVRQYVRETNAPKTKKGVKSGKNSARDAEVMSRYTQMISLWIQKFKVYPEDARKAGLKGATVVRIRVDRRGNIRYYALERSTGIEALDRAAIDMIRRANPVPAVPADYPAGDVFEFLVPVNFSLL